MSRRKVYRLLCGVAERDYADIVERAGFDDESARVYFKDGSFLEVWFHRNEDLMKRYAFHWERRHVDGSVHRHDNAPHIKWSVASFPKHFHSGTEDYVIESRIPDDPVSAFRYCLDYVRGFKNIDGNV